MKWVMTESEAYAAYVSPDDRRSELFGYYGSYCVAEEAVKGSLGGAQMVQLIVSQRN